MQARKSERLVKLVILLLVARHYTTKEQIRASMEEYQQAGTEAFERMFERDKDDLRALGIPVETGMVDKFFDDEVGYRIRPDAYRLPPLQFSAEEAAVLGLAARVWQHAGMAGATSDALRKLKASGLEIDARQLEALRPAALAAEEPAFEPMLRAHLDRRPVAFDYARPDQARAHRRHLQPWGVVTAQGRWYAVGLDTDRGEVRMFRLSRISSDVLPDGEPGSYDVPDDVDLRSLTDSIRPPAPDRDAVLLVRRGRGQALRRLAAERDDDVPGPDDDTWDRLVVPFASQADFASEVLGSVDAVVVVEPADLRAEVAERLRAVLAAGGAA